MYDRGAVLSLADLVPTPVERVELMPQRVALWVKRDDRVASIYGGNKVRKLEHLLGTAHDAGKRKVLTVGAVGSHQIVALALFGERLGFEVEAVVVPQPASEHARTNLRVALAHGLRAIPTAAWSLAPLVVAARWSRDAVFVPLGGSNVRGSLGFVSAARELALQVAAGELPEPDEIVVAMGSGGTAAGLAAGLEREGLRTRVVGVAISHPTSALGVAARRLAFATARSIGLGRRASVRAAMRIELEAGYVGRGYGFTTDAGTGAIAAAERAGLELDPSYTSKAFAAAIARARSRRVLFWHTLSTVPLPAVPDVPLPRALERLLR